MIMMDYPQGKRTPVLSNPWVDGNDLLQQVDTWVDCENRHIAECRWRDTEQTVLVDLATNEIVGFGSTTK